MSAATGHPSPPPRHINLNPFGGEINMHKEDTTVLVSMRDTFDGASLSVLNYRGRPCWVASEVDRAIGTPRPDAGSQWARRSEDYREGKDGEQVEGEALAALKEAGVVGANAPSATLLYESGLTLYLMASGAEKARRFRWHLVDEVLPALRKASDPVATLLSRAGTIDQRWDIVLASTEAREIHALWTAATALRKAEVAASNAKMEASRRERRQELLVQQRLAVELNNKERRALQAGLLREMRTEIEDHRAGKRRPFMVRGLAERVDTVILDERACRGGEPYLLRATEARHRADPPPR